MEWRRSHCDSPLDATKNRKTPREASRRRARRRGVHPRIPCGSNRSRAHDDLPTGTRRDLAFASYAGATRGGCACGSSRLARLHGGGHHPRSSRRVPRSGSSTAIGRRSDNGEGACCCALQEKASETRRTLIGMPSAQTSVFAPESSATLEGLCNVAGHACMLTPRSGSADHAARVKHRP